jgi:hypothetical protein
MKTIARSAVSYSRPETGPHTEACRRRFMEALGFSGR